MKKLNALLAIILLAFFVCGSALAFPPVSPGTKIISGNVDTNGRALRVGSPSTTLTADITAESAVAGFGGPIIIYGPIKYQVESLGEGTGQTVMTYGVSELTSDNDTTDEAGTLGDGAYPGQRKFFVMVTDGGDDWDLTVTNHRTSDPEVFEFDDANDTLTLEWTGVEWITTDYTCTIP